MFTSTRDNLIHKSSSMSLLEGLSHEGGLYVYENFDQIHLPFSQMQNMSYYDLATTILHAFLSDFTMDEIKECVDKAYVRFPKGDVTPMVKLKNGYILELFQGPTSAFKDVALQLLPQLMRKARKKINLQKDILILTATSGDTGKAALEGFCDVEGVHIAVFYPQDGTSKIQELQMITQIGKNTHVASVKGNFDDCQSAIKHLMSDSSFKKMMQDKGVVLSSANSINIGRLLPQMVYYFYAYYQLLNHNEIEKSQQVDFVVPTGNFGDILAGYYAKKLGLPIRRLVCASNSNRVLTDFIQTGRYDRRREFHVTSSPSMDILISSNLERLLYDVTNGDCKKVKEWMTQLSTQGYYDVDKQTLSKIQETFVACCCDDKATSCTIADVWQHDHYLLDPHSAVAYYAMRQVKQDDVSCVVLATASPYKFTKTVCNSMNLSIENKDEFIIMKELSSFTKVSIPSNLSRLESMPIIHQSNLEPKDIAAWVKELLGK